VLSVSVNLQEAPGTMYFSDIICALPGNNERFARLLNSSTAVWKESLFKTSLSPCEYKY
jgi:hypothetical protein